MRLAIVLLMVVGCSSGGRGNAPLPDTYVEKAYLPAELPEGSLRVGIPSCYKTSNTEYYDRTHWLTPAGGYCRGEVDSDEYVCSPPGQIYDPVHHVIYKTNGHRDDCIGSEADWSDSWWPSIFEDKCTADQWCRCESDACDGKATGYACQSDDDCRDGTVCKYASNVPKCLGTTPK